MENSIVGKVSAWSESKLSDDQLLEALEGSKPSLETHRSGFEQVVNDFTDEQREQCRDLLDFCFLLFDQLANAVGQCVAGVQEQDRNGVFFYADVIARSAHQLNLAQAELRNRALLALGPTQIPNFNLLIQRRDDYLGNPNESTKLLFSEAVDSERIVVYEGMEALAKEPDLPEVGTLYNAFKDHLSNLNSLAEALVDDGVKGDYETIFLELGVSFPELQKLVPLVQMKLRGTGQTEFPDLNNLIKLMEDVAQGNISDTLLVDATEAAEMAFGKTKEQLAQVQGQLPSALANEEIAAALESFEEFEDGIEAIYKFLEERDRLWLVEAKGCLTEFGKLFAAHQNRLKEIEEQQGQLLCPMCSTANDSTRSRCSKCGSPLPQNVAASTVSTFESREQTGLEAQEESRPLVTANLEKLYLAVNEMAAGNSDDESFLQAVDHFEGQIEANLNSLPAEPEVTDSAKQQAVGLLYDALENGVETMRSALDLMRSFPENRDQDVLIKAVQLMDEGAKLVAAAGEAAKR